MTLVAESRRLCLVLERIPETVFEPEFVADAPLIRFEAYADRGRIFGWVRLREDRLTDLLNQHPELLLVNAELEDLDDGRRSSADEILVHREQLIAVHASGPRGHAHLRQPTTSHPVSVHAGPYRIGGRVHAPPEVDPVLSFQQRPAMVPLTEAWIEYRTGHIRERQAVGTLVINRDLAQRIELASDEVAVPG
ncbi:MAG TPA: hypothetical protein VH813_02715 [Candidatus Limnocylindrales bacterium]|jgi:hypothetical protein